MPKRRAKNAAREAFTLLEVMLVLVIIAVLSAFAVGTFTGTQRRAAINEAEGQIGLFKTPLSLYNLHVRSYPTNSQGLAALVTAPSDLADASKWGGPYLDSVPLDPWDQEYQYTSPGSDNRDFDIWSQGPDQQDGTDDDIMNK